MSPVPVGRGRSLPALATVWGLSKRCSQGQGTEAHHRAVPSVSRPGGRLRGRGWQLRSGGTRSGYPSSGLAKDRAPAKNHVSRCGLRLISARFGRFCRLGTAAPPRVGAANGGFAGFPRVRACARTYRREYTTSPAHPPSRVSFAGFGKATESKLRMANSPAASHPQPKVIEVEIETAISRSRSLSESSVGAANLAHAAAG
jgi:hypothetical protein